MQIILVLVFIGRKSGAPFAGQPQSQAMQNQSKRNLLSTLLKTTLS